LIPVLLPDADPPVFLQDQQYVRLGDDASAWERIAQMLDGSSSGASRWRTSDTARSIVADRLSVLEKVAAELPDDPEFAH